MSLNLYPYMLHYYVQSPKATGHHGSKEKVSINLLKGRFSPKRKWHSVLIANCCWFSLANSRRPQPFSSTAPLTICKILELLVVIFLQPSPTDSITAAIWELCFVSSVCQFFFFLKAWAVLYWCTVLCICAEISTASMACWVYCGPEAVHCCTKYFFFWSTCNNLVNPEKVICSVHKQKQTHHLHRQWRGSQVKRKSFL